MKAKIFDWYTDIYPTQEEVETLCRPGAGTDTCSWLLMGPKGWQCCCLHKLFALIGKLERGEMVAQRDGCEKVNTFSPGRYGLGEVEF